MMVQTIKFAVFILVALDVTVKADLYFPCKSYISFSYDDSNSISSNEFRTQMNFIKNVIGKMNYPNRLRTEGAVTGEFNWNSGLSITQMQAAIGNAIQTSNQYSLLQQAASLLTSVEVLDSINDPIAALIFISDTSDAALRNADRWFARLRNIGITFILLGPNVNSLKLRQFSKNFIYWPDLTEPEPDNWDLLSYNAFGCNMPSSPTTPQQLSTSPISSSTATSISPITRTTTTTTPSNPYIPCQSWIHFGIDDSNVLSDKDFNIEKNFISNAIRNITHPERIAAVTSGISEVSWNSIFSISEIQWRVKNLMHQSYPYNLKNQFTALLYDLERTQINNIPVGAVIFVSDTSNNALSGAADIFRRINQIQNVRFTFVLLGKNVDQNKLTQFSNNFIFWSNFSQNQPDNWNLFYATQYGCTGEISTLGSTSTVTTVTSTQTSLTPSIPYIPCQSWISFVIDDSDKLYSNLFTNQLNFISNAIGNITHPERLAALSMYNDGVQWNNSLTVPQIQQSVTQINQGGSYRLRLQFASFVTNLESVQEYNFFIGALIFISDTSDAALAGADQIYNQIAGTQITFVLLGNNVNSSKLTQFSNSFIYWPDLTKSQPDNWDLSYPYAYRCKN